MPSTKKPKTTDEIMEEASRALVETRYFECERLCLKALARAMEEHLFEDAARILLPLLESRRQKRLAAIDTGRLTVMEESPGEEPKIEAGCYLFQPPLVAADARAFREHADAQEVPVLVVCREPKTRLGQWPVVMIGPVTVRTRIPPPPKEKPTIEWMVEASEALGDEAIAAVDRGRELTTQIVGLYDRLATCPEHEKLHQALEDACKEAARRPNGHKKAG